MSKYFCFPLSLTIVSTEASSSWSTVECAEAMECLGVVRFIVWGEGSWDGNEGGRGGGGVFTGGGGGGGGTAGVTTGSSEESKVEFMSWTRRFEVCP